MTQLNRPIGAPSVFGLDQRSVPIAWPSVMSWTVVESGGTAGGNGGGAGAGAGAGTGAGAGAPTEGGGAVNSGADPTPGTKPISPQPTRLASIAEVAILAALEKLLMDFPAKSEAWTTPLRRDLIGRITSTRAADSNSLLRRIGRTRRQSAMRPRYRNRSWGWQPTA